MGVVLRHRALPFPPLPSFLPFLPFRPSLPSVPSLPSLPLPPSSRSSDCTSVLAIEPHFVQKGCTGTRTSQFYHSFGRSNFVSCERVAPDDLQIAILPQFLAIEPHFVRKGCVSCRLVGTAPHLQERNRKEGEGKRARGEDVKM